MMYDEVLRADCALVEDYLQHCFAGRDSRADLYDAMLYSLLAGGKRIRPVLALETCRMCGGDVSSLFSHSRRSALHGRRRSAPGSAHQP